MTFLELVQRRQSTRNYKPDPVPREILDRCLEAARLAPSACNSQPWSFLVVDQPDLRARLADAAFGGLYTMCAFAKSAPVLIVMITEPAKPVARLGGLWRGVQYNLIDIGIAGEHLALQAAAEGLGSCWLGWFDEKAVRKVLGLPRSTRIDVLFSMGWPTTPEVREKVRKPLAAVRRYGV